jgi:hypothetical protein
MTVPLMLEVAISMVFLYLLGSQVVLSIYEIWAGYRNVRGKFLYENLKGTLGGATAKALFAQAPIAALSPSDQPPPTAVLEKTVRWWMGKDGLPAYVPPDLFASTLLQMVAPAVKTSSELLLVVQVATIQQAVATNVLPAAHLSTATLNSVQLALQNADLPIVEQNALTTVQHNASVIPSPPVWYSLSIAKLLSDLLNGLPATAPSVDCQARVAAWYDAYGERLTGWYKRRTRLWLFLIGLVLAFVVNIDSPFIIRYLWTHPQLSTRLADAATIAVQTPADSNKNRPSPDTAATAAIRAQATAVIIREFDARLGKLGFPIGRDDTTKVDSARLSSPFYVRQPARFLSQKGGGRHFIPEHYLKYICDTTKASLPVAVSQTLRWQKTRVRPQDIDTVELRRKNLLRKADATGKIDSTKLPSVFYVYVKADTTKGPEYYARYTRTGTANASRGVAGVAGEYTTRWRMERVAVKDVAVQTLPEGSDRSTVVPSVFNWWERLFTKQWWARLFNPQPQWMLITWLGWLLTAAALSIGAPFWFDLLCRFVNIRNLGIKPPPPGK